MYIINNINTFRSSNCLKLIHFLRHNTDDEEEHGSLLDDFQQLLISVDEASYRKTAMVRYLYF